MTLPNRFVKTWTDEFLKWNITEKYNISSLHFDVEEIWMPDIALYNRFEPSLKWTVSIKLIFYFSASNADITPKSKLPILVYDTGSVYWAPHFTAQVPCRMDISQWPSDEHTCSLLIGSWSHHGEQINLEVQTMDGVRVNASFLRKN